MSLASNKASYLISDGLGPLIKSELLNDVRQSGNPYTIGFDEIPNVQYHNQLELNVRFWSEKRQEVMIHYLSTFMLGHTQADKVESAVVSEIDADQLRMKELLTLSRDGPNVTKKVFRLLSDRLKGSSGYGFVDIGSCNLHVMHNAFLKGL